MRAICINKSNGQMLYFFFVVLVAVVGFDDVLVIIVYVYKITHRKCAGQVWIFHS